MSEKNYKLQIVFSFAGTHSPQGETIEFDNPQEAFIRAILILKMSVNGDLIQAEKYGNSTLIKFLEDDSLQVLLTPNIIAPGHDKIGPYSFQYATMLNDLPEN